MESPAKIRVIGNEFFSLPFSAPYSSSRDECRGVLNKRTLRYSRKFPTVRKGRKGRKVSKDALDPTGGGTFNSVVECSLIRDSIVLEGGRVLQ